MQTFFSKLGTGFVGTSAYEKFDAEDEVEAEKIAYDLAIENAESYFFIVYEGDEEPDEEEYVYGADYTYEDDVSYTLEVYDPEEHDMYLY